jgi:hypothetical protein
VGFGNFTRILHASDAARLVVAIGAAIVTSLLVACISGIVVSDGSGASTTASSVGQIGACTVATEHLPAFSGHLGR